MGCTSSLFETPVGCVAITITPADNLDVGSYELIYNIPLNESMFKKKKNKNTGTIDEGDNANVPTYRIPIEPLTGPITKISVDFQISKEIDVENGKVDIALTRSGTVVATRGLFGGDNDEPFRLDSVTYGSTTGNPVVNLSQAGDYYEIRIFLK